MTEKIRSRDGILRDVVAFLVRIRIAILSISALFAFVVAQRVVLAEHPDESVAVNAAGSNDGHVPLPSRNKRFGHLKPLGVFRHGQLLDSGAAEIVKYHLPTKSLYVVNGELQTIDVLSIVDPAKPRLARRIPLAEYGGTATHVAVRDNLVAVALSGTLRTDAGSVAFFHQDGEHLGSIATGPLPDMLEFTPDGRHVVTANEGEPSDDYSIDPEGSITIIDLPAASDSSDAAAKPLNSDTCGVRHVTFQKFNAGNLPEGVRIGNAKASVAEDLEPEYLTFSADSKTAWVVLQENNALAVVDLERGEATELIPLGEKAFSGSGVNSACGLDASDQDHSISMIDWPVRAFYQPDGIASYSIGGETWLVTANEGDHRLYPGFRDVFRVSELLLDPNAFPNANELKRASGLGRLMISSTDGDKNGDGMLEELHTFGARSFSIWSSRGDLVFDSGSMIEQMIADQFPEAFNSNLGSESFDDRSDDKGPEPEGVAVGVVDGRTLAFIGLERFSGILVADVTNPGSPKIVQLYKQAPTFAAGGSEPTAIRDQAPEGLTFISAETSPNGKPLLAVAYEYSGTTRIYEVNGK